MDVAGPGRRRDRPLWRAVRYGSAAVCVALGLFAAFVTVVLGHCSSFGGTCPSPGLEGDVLGGVGIGVGLAVAAPIIAIRPDRHGVLRALATAVPLGLGAGLVATLALTR